LKEKIQPHDNITSANNVNFLLTPTVLDEHSPEPRVVSEVQNNLKHKVEETKSKMKVGACRKLSVIKETDLDSSDDKDKSSNTGS
jgi:hypothetical protein